MKNIGRRFALGFTLLVTLADTHETRVGLRSRLRGWITEVVTLDVSVGRFIGSGGGRDNRSFTGELALGVGDWIAITGQLERSPTAGWAWYNGMKLGSGPGLTAEVMAFLIVGMMVSAAFN